MIDLAYETVFNSFSKKIQNELLKEDNDLRKEKWRKNEIVLPSLYFTMKSLFVKGYPLFLIFFPF